MKRKEERKKSVCCLLPYIRTLVDDPGFLEQEFSHLCTLHLALPVEFDRRVLSESGRVVVEFGLGVAECFKNWADTYQLIFETLELCAFRDVNKLLDK